MTSSTYQYANSKIYDPTGVIPIGMQSPVGDLIVSVVPQGGQSAIPIIFAPNGTVDAAGVITLGTALALTYANAWVYLPAGAIVGGAAGLYYCTFSSTTVGAVKTNYVNPTTTAFTPFIPSNPVAAVGSGSGYTQTTGSNLAIVNVPIPGKLMGPNGKLKVMQRWSYPNNANNKIVRNALNGTTFAAATLTTTTVLWGQSIIENRGAENSQVFGTIGSVTNFSTAAGSTSTGTLTQSTVDTTVAQALTLLANLATATDFLILESFVVEVVPG